jgi:hypothetical protein
LQDAVPFADVPGLLQAATTMATIGKIAANLRIDTVGLLLLKFDDQLIGGIFVIGALYPLGRVNATRNFAPPQPRTAS